MAATRARSSRADSSCSDAAHPASRPCCRSCGPRPCRESPALARCRSGDAALAGDRRARRLRHRDDGVARSPLGDSAAYRSVAPPGGDAPQRRFGPACADRHDSRRRRRQRPAPGRRGRAARRGAARARPRRRCRAARGTAAAAGARGAFARLAAARLGRSLATALRTARHRRAAPGGATRRPGPHLRGRRGHRAGHRR